MAHGIIKILTTIRRASGIAREENDDLYCQFNYRYMVGALLVLAVASSSRQLWGDRIICFTPAHFSSAWNSYVQEYCWASHTYYFPLKNFQPHKFSVKRKRLDFYPWVPFILLGQAALFMLPSKLWSHLMWRSGIDIQGLVGACKLCPQLHKTAAGERMRYSISFVINRYLTNREEKSFEYTWSWSSFLADRIQWWKIGRKFGNYLSFSFLFTKVLYITNILGQMMLLQWILHIDFFLYGYNAFHDWKNMRDMTFSNHFPKVTMCDVRVRYPGSYFRYTVQCLMPINLFNEYLYLLVWVAMVLLCILNMYSLIIWALRCFSLMDRHRFIKKNLRPNERGYVRANFALYMRFVEDYLAKDGVLILHLIMENTDLISAADIVGSLWMNYVEHEGDVGDELEILADECSDVGDVLESLADDCLSEVDQEQEEAATANPRGHQSSPSLYQGGPGETQSQSPAVDAEIHHEEPPKHYTTMSSTL